MGIEENRVNQTHEVIVKNTSVMARFVMETVTAEAALKQTYDYLVSGVKSGPLSVDNPTWAQILGLHPVESLDVVTMTSDKQIFQDGVLLLEHRTHPLPEIPYFQPAEESDCV